MTSTSEPKESNKTDYETVAASIAELIKTNNLKPGDRLPTERELSSQLKVSRAIVRDAVKVLTAAGLVQSKQGSGLYVTATPHPFASAAIDLSMPVDPEHIVGLYQFRITLETAAARMAAENISVRELRVLEEAATLHRLGATEMDAVRFREGDVAFHQGVADATRNPFFISAISTTMRLQNWAVDVAIAGTPGSLLMAADQHQAILEAIRSSNMEAAADTMRLHLETSLSNYQSEMRKRLFG